VRELLQGRILYEKHNVMLSKDLRPLNQFVLVSLLLGHVHAVHLQRDPHVEEADLVTVDIAEVDPEPDHRREDDARAVAVDLAVDLHEGDHQYEGVDLEVLEKLRESDPNPNHDPNLHVVVVEVDRATNADERDQDLGQLLDHLVVARRDQNQDLNLVQHRQVRRSHRDDQALVHPIALHPRKRRKIRIVSAIKTRIRIRTKKKDKDKSKEKEKEKEKQKDEEKSDDKELKNLLNKIKTFEEKKEKKADE